MTTPQAAFGDDPGTDTFTVYVDGVQVDPATLAGYVATGPDVSITEAAKTGDWTIRDDGLVEYVRPMTAMQPGQLTAQHNPPGAMCVVVCDQAGAVVRIEGSPVPDGAVLGAPLPVHEQVPQPEPAAPVVEDTPTPPVADAPASQASAPAAPAPPTRPILDPAPKASIHQDPQSRGFWVRIEHVGGEIEHVLQEDLQKALAYVVQVVRAHFQKKAA